MPRPCECGCCHLCRKWANDPRYRKLWGGESLVPATVVAAASQPCVHLGNLTGETRECPTCQGNVKVKLRVCGVHGQCTEAKAVPGVECCIGCKDRCEGDIDDDGTDSIPEPELDPMPNGWADRPDVKDRHVIGFRSMLRRRFTRPIPETGLMGDGIVTCGGGKYWPGIVVQTRMLRESGCTLPVQAWYRGSEETVNSADVEGLDVQLIDAERAGTHRILRGWEVKSHALVHCGFRRALYLDADAYCVADPAPLFSLLDRAPFAFWEDLPHTKRNVGWSWFGLEDKTDAVPTVQGGQLLIDLDKFWREIRLIHWLDQHSDYFYAHAYGDQDARRAVLAATSSSFLNLGPATWKHPAFDCRVDGKSFAVHRCQGKFFPGTLPSRNDALPKEREAFDHFLSLGIPEKAPTYSVVVPTHNAAPFLKQCLHSLLNQTETDLEVIVVDDGSTDRTQALLRSLTDPRLRCFRKDNGGTGSALNVGFSVARGEYQTWWSADSWVESTFLADLRAALDANPQASMAFSDWRIHHDGKNTPQTVPEFDAKLLKRDCFVGPCWLFRKGTKERAGPYSEKLCEDYDFHLRMAEIGPFARVPKVLGTWRQHPGNLTATVAVPQKMMPNLRAKARHAWKRSKVKVVIACPFIDAAGASSRLWRGLNDWSESVGARMIVGEIVGKCGHPYDLLVTGGKDDAEIKRVLDESDLIHVNQAWPGAKECRIDLLPWLRRKPWILHMHGGQWEWDLRKVKAWQDAGARILTCCPHVPARLPGATWVPNYLPITPPGEKPGHLWDEHLYSPMEGKPRRSFTVGCWHNYEAGKGMMQLQEMFEILKKQNGFTGNSVVGQSGGDHADHCRTKKGVHAVVDQITQGFIGMAGWEAMAMGLPVLARLDDFAVQAYLQLGNGWPPPIVNCRWIDEVAEWVLRFDSDPEEAADVGNRSRAWMLEHYHALKVVGIYERIYAETLAEKR